ncbi:hypothetical protein TNCV_2050851 [Trichonephila clavipes]|nr:hypothetical protein TNCV_2050851 [Trichonephila clavipes]
MTTNDPMGLPYVKGQCSSRSVSCRLPHRDEGVPMGGMGETKYLGPDGINDQMLSPLDTRARLRLLDILICHGTPGVFQGIGKRPLLFL